MTERWFAVAAALLLFVGLANAQSCTNGEKRLHAEDECIPPLLFNYLYCLQISGGGKVEVVKRSGDQNSKSAEIQLSGKGSGVILKGAAAVGYKQADVNNATRELQEKIDPTLAAKCERIATSITGTLPRTEERPPASKASVEATPKPRKQSGSRIREVVVLGTALSGFSCQTASYGNDWARDTRERIEDDLYKVYGCTEPPEASSKPGFSGNFHTPANSDGPWPGFASRSTVLYYDADNKSKAEAVAQDLSQRYRHKFDIARGAGQGIPYQWYKRTIEIHVRESGS